MINSNLIENIINAPGENLSSSSEVGSRQFSMGVVLSKKRKNNDIERVNKKRRERREKNKDAENKRQREWRKKNPDKLALYAEKNKNTIKYKERNKLRYEKRKENPEQYNEWKRKNKEKIKGYYEKYNKKKSIEISFILKTRLKKRLKKVLDAIKLKKQKKTENFLGCNIAFFKKHIESNFKEGMNWGNYGYLGWHIDHVIPITKFNIELPEAQAICFNYKNLMPMWGKDNMSKGNKINFDFVSKVYINELKSKNILL